jgi:phosphatidylserine/phosphatidylglycerophosphate/cardiolipin synthase-like enzyme
MRSWTLDLRGAVVDLAAAAQHDLVLASPFWDAATVDDIGPVLEGRLDAGVRVRLLGRFERGIGADVRNAIAPLIAHPACKLLGWFEPSEGDPFGARTFHFKAAIADGGARGYLGTANFTESGLRSRLELGVLLEGETARRLADVVDAVLSLAHPINPMNS